MEDHMKRLYLMTTRNSELFTKRNLSKYLPLKKDIINYDSILELNRNLEEVQMAFGLDKSKQRKKAGITSGKNPKISVQSKPQKRMKDTPQNRMLSLLQISKNNRSNNHPSSLQSSPHSSKPTNITIIENDPLQPQQSHNQRNNQPYDLRLNESELDSYVNQYLEELMKGEKEDGKNVKEDILVDRRRFVERAVRNIQEKMKHEKSVGILQTERQNTSTGQVSSKSLAKVHSDNPQNAIKTERKTDICKPKPKITREKRKCKSTQLISAQPTNNQTITHQKNPSNCLPQIKPHSYSTETTRCMPQRSVYNNTPNSSFITKIGKSFYMNELGTLKKTLELQAKNRERAQKFFRRKLMNIQRQHEKLMSKENTWQHLQNQERIKCNDEVQYNFY